jgi:hypothetical protein
LYFREQLENLICYKLTFVAIPLEAAENLTIGPEIYLTSLIPEKSA